MPDPYSDKYIFYYIFAGLSFCCSLYVTRCILLMNSVKSSSTRIILYLHLTLLIEDIASLPFIFTGNRGLCKFIGFIKYYSGLANICVIGLMIILYRAMLFQAQPIKDFIARSSEYIIFVFPLITLLPFISDSYTGIEQTWCVMDGDETAQVWSIGVFYVWAWLLILVTVLVITMTLYDVFKIDRELFKKLFNSIGMYTIVSVVCWIPRSINRVRRLSGESTLVGYYGDTIVLFLSGFLYFLIFLTEKTGVIKFETEDDSNFRFSVSTMGGDNRASVNEHNLNRLSILSSTGPSETLERESVSFSQRPISSRSNSIANPIIRPAQFLEGQIAPGASASAFQEQL